MCYTEEVHRQPDVIAHVGQNFTVPCRTSPGRSGVWWYQDTAGAPIKDVFNVRGDVMNGFKRSGRFSLAWDNEGDYSLIITTVSVSDAGLFTCIIDDGYGDYFIRRITVVGRPQAIHR